MRKVNREWPLRAMALLIGLVLGACFMPHGYPPWSGIKKQTVFTVPLDLAELAARLGSIVTYDRRGDVIAMFTFDQGIQGAPIGVDHGDSVGSLSTETALSGPWSLKMNPRAAADAYVNWRNLVFPLTVGKIGAEFALCVIDSPEEIYFRLMYFEAAHWHSGHLTYYPATGDWKILKTDDSEKTILSGYELQTGPAAWHYVKIVIDTETDKFLRILIDDETPDVSGLDLREGSPGALGSVEVKVEVTGSVASSGPIYLDSVIVTQNEPGRRE